MSAAPTDRDEKDDAPEPSSNPWVTWMVWLVVAPLLYVLSSGPMCWLVKNNHLPPKALLIYHPIDYLPSDIRHLCLRYGDWWTNYTPPAPDW